MAYQTGYRTTISKLLSPWDNEVIVATPPSITRGRLFCDNGWQKEWMLFTWVSGNTLTWLVRQLSTSWVAASLWDGETWVAGSQITIVAMHDQLIDQSAEAVNIDLWTHNYNSTTNWQVNIQQVTEVQRDALQNIRSWTLVYNTDAAALEIYSGGIWDTFDLWTPTPNATTTVAGKVELATEAQVLAWTEIGETSATLVANNKQIFDRRPFVVVNTSWQWDYTSVSAAITAGHKRILLKYSYTDASAWTIPAWTTVEIVWVGSPVVTNSNTIAFTSSTGSLFVHWVSFTVSAIAAWWVVANSSGNVKFTNCLFDVTAASANRYILWWPHTLDNCIININTLSNETALMSVSDNSLFHKCKININSETISLNAGWYTDCVFDTGNIWLTCEYITNCTFSSIWVYSWSINRATGCFFGAAWSASTININDISNCECNWGINATLTTQGNNNITNNLIDWLSLDLSWWVSVVGNNILLRTSGTDITFSWARNTLSSNRLVHISATTGFAITTNQNTIIGNRSTLAVNTISGDNNTVLGNTNVGTITWWSGNAIANNT